MTRDAFDIDAVNSSHVHVQLASHANASMAVSDHALDAAKSLHKEANRYRRELTVKFTKQCCQSIAGQHAVHHERHFRLQFIQKSPDARA
jgi:hypothetical protein